MAERPDITPDLKIGALLDAYPELETVLIDAAPPFVKLRNPLLRRTVAAVTSLRQAALVGGLPLGELIEKLRAAAGLAAGTAAAEADAPAARPGWLDTTPVAAIYDARADIDAGQHPVGRVLADLKALAPGTAYVLVTPFTPAPLIDKARAAGFEAWTETAGAQEFRTAFRHGA